MSITGARVISVSNVRTRVDEQARRVRRFHTTIEYEIPLDEGEPQFQGSSDGDQPTKNEIKAGQVTQVRSFREDRHLQQGDFVTITIDEPVDVGTASAPPPSAPPPKPSSSKSKGTGR